MDDALDTISRQHSNISILHCVSQYPTEPDNVNLHTITYLKKNYPDYKIGFSDHTIGISAAVAAVAMGSEIVEKHITIDRRMKGTDQQGSLGPEGVMRMVRDIRLIERSMGKEEIFVEEKTKSAREKLERSIATKKMIKKGDTILADDIHMLSPGDGFKWSEKDSVIGKTAGEDIQANEVIYPNQIN